MKNWHDNVVWTQKTNGGKSLERRQYVFYLALGDV